MRILRIIALGGAAVLALGANAMASQSSAQERAQTRQLNIAQQNGAQPTASPTAHAAVPVAIAPGGYSAASFGPAPALAPMALNSFSSPPDKLATARLVNASGVILGAVRSIDILGGKPARVEIALSGTARVIWLDAQSVSYDAVRNVLMASGNDLQAPQG